MKFAEISYAGLSNTIIAEDENHPLNVHQMYLQDAYKKIYKALKVTTTTTTNTYNNAR